MSYPSADLLEPEAVADFESVRPRLFGIAYQRLGRAADAEDVVQNVWVRWQGADRAQVADLHGHRAVVVLAGRRPPQRCLEEATAQVPAPQFPEQRLAGGQHQRQQVPVQPPVGRRGRRRGDLLPGEPVQLRGVAHPDGGGSDWLATRVNQAKDVLLGKR